MKTYDAVVVGEGPAGITAALYLARSGCSVLMFEHMAAGGQTLATEVLENYPGFPHGIKGYELADVLAEHLEGLAIDRPRGEVSSVTGSQGHFIVKAEANEDRYEARTVLVCTGAWHKHLGVPREEELIGRGVSYCALCDGGFYRGKQVAVVGGGNSAMEESLYLARIVDKVHLIHRRGEFRGAKVYQDKLEQAGEKVEIHFNSTVVALLGDTELTGVTLKNLETGAESELAVSGLFVYVGFEPKTAFLPPEIQKDGQGFVITDTEMRTSIPGIFAAGDIRSKMCRQVITACGDGATAAHAAFVLLEQMHD